MANAVAKLIVPHPAELESEVFRAIQARTALTITVQREDPFGSESEQLQVRIRVTTHEADEFRVIGSTTDELRRTVTITVPDGNPDECSVEYYI